MADSLRAGISRPANQHALMRGRHRHVELWPYRMVSDLLSAIQGQGSEGVRKRDALTRVLIELHRAEKSSLWSELLIVTYYPLLHRICRKIAPGRLAQDDIYQIVTMGFLSAISNLDPAVYRNISFGIEQRTRRATFDVLAKEHRYERSITLSLGSSGEGFEDTEAVAFTEDNIEQISLMQLMNRARKKGVSKRALKVITITQDETLRSYCVRRRKTETAYQRMKKQKTRALTRLREMASED